MKSKFFICFIHLSSFLFAQNQGDTTSFSQRNLWDSLLLPQMSVYRENSNRPHAEQLLQLIYEKCASMKIHHINWSDTLLLYSIDFRNDRSQKIVGQEKMGRYLFYKTPMKEYRLLFFNPFMLDSFYDKSTTNIFSIYLKYEKTAKKERNLYRQSDEIMYETSYPKASPYPQYDTQLLFEEVAFFYQLHTIEDNIWHIPIKIKEGYQFLKLIDPVNRQRYPAWAALLATTRKKATNSPRLLVKVNKAKVKEIDD